MKCCVDLAARDTDLAKVSGTHFDTTHTASYTGTTGTTSTFTEIFRTFIKFIDENVTARFTTITPRPCRSMRAAILLPDPSRFSSQRENEWSTRNGFMSHRPRVRETIKPAQII